MIVCEAWLRPILLLCMRYCQGYKAVIVPCVAHDAVILTTWVDILDLHCQALCLALLQQLGIESLHMAIASRECNRTPIFYKHFLRSIPHPDGRQSCYYHIATRLKAF